MNSYHVPVLLKESVDALVTDENGVYLDLTFGGGGHSAEILNRLSNEGKLYAFDQDDEALANVLNDKRVKFVKSNFKYHRRFLKYYNEPHVDGVLADLGISSHQIDVDYRGFSFRFHGELDMRMSTGIKNKASDVLNTYPEEKLQRVFWDYGELKQGRKLAAAVVSRRKQMPFDRIQDFVVFLDAFIRSQPAKFMAKVFQALRIEVNGEMDALKKMLTDLLFVLKPGSRVVMISYHSLEDRLVKNFFKTGNIEGNLIKDDFGNVLNPLKEVNRKIIIPNDEEIARNNRSRSAKMRIAEFVGLK